MLVLGQTFSAYSQGHYTVHLLIMVSQSKLAVLKGSEKSCNKEL